MNDAETCKLFNQQLFAVVHTQNITRTVRKQIISREIRVCVDIRQDVVRYNSETEYKQSIRLVINSYCSYQRLNNDNLKLLTLINICDFMVISP